MVLWCVSWYLMITAFMYHEIYMVLLNTSKFTAIASDIFNHFYFIFNFSIQIELNRILQNPYKYYNVFTWQIKSSGGSLEEYIGTMGK